MQDHPIHVVSAWIGNSPAVALGHYLQTLDSDFEKALKGAAESGAANVQKAVQSEAALSIQETPRPPEVLRIVDLRRSVVVPEDERQEIQMTLRGFEPRSQP
jgi:hypothetical protein